MSSEFERVRRITAEVTGVGEQEIRERTRVIEDLGADSLDLFEILTRVEEECRVAIPGHAVSRVVTVGDAADILVEVEHRAI